MLKKKKNERPTRLRHRREPDIRNSDSVCVNIIKRAGLRHSFTIKLILQTEQRAVVTENRRDFIDIYYDNNVCTIVFDESFDSENRMEIKRMFRVSK